MTEIQYKEGDKLLVTGNIDTFRIGEVVTVDEVDYEDAEMPYYISNNQVEGWLLASQLSGVQLLSSEPAEDDVEITAEPSQKLDSYTVDYIYNELTDNLAAARESGTSVEMLTAAWVGYITGLQAGVKNA